MGRKEQAEMAETVKSAMHYCLSDEYRFLSELEECNSVKQVREKLEKRMKEILKDLEVL
jgi:predicted nucleotidyltransferase